MESNELVVKLLLFGANPLTVLSTTLALKCFKITSQSVVQEVNIE